MKKTCCLLILILTCMNNVYSQNQDYLFMIEQAAKAPSGHNTQPWLFKINESSIEIHPNLTKSLPVVDPHNRELFISLGCATENLCIAAACKGYASAVTISGEGIITISLQKDESVTYDPLLEQIPLRQTNRSVYNGQTVPDSAINRLKEIPLHTGLNAYFYKNGTVQFDSIASLVTEGNVMQMQNKDFTRELKSWMRFNKKHQDKTNDGLSYAVFGAPNLPMFIIKPIMSNYLNPKTQNKGDTKKIRSSSHFVLFTTEAHTVEQWIDLGRSLERFLLKSTELGIVHAYTNQPNEVEELQSQMIDALQLRTHPAILLRIGYGEKMPYSKRKNFRELIMDNSKRK